MIPLRDNIPTSRTPVVTYALIAANILVYFFWQQGGFTLGDPSNAHYICQLQDWAAIPHEITNPGDQVLIAQGCPSDPTAPTWATVFTAMFMHGGLLHLGGNMLFLWIFGNNVEDAMGPLKFIVFYLLAGIAALALQVVIDPSSTVPTLGASGAIAGVLGGYIVRFPRARVVSVIFIVFFFTIIELPALLVLGFWFIQQALYGYFDLAQPTGGGGGGVAYFAHIGGFVFGLLAIRVFARRRRSAPPSPFARR
ncbi:MAG TPA: rhomboid family intramembrane serine protease [Solirubrobacter sp.]|nr:rhomboid family intramembrane serine protease [Solirubrobacter sp.]